MDEPTRILLALAGSWQEEVQRRLQLLEYRGSGNTMIATASLASAESVSGH